MVRLKYKTEPNLTVSIPNSLFSFSTSERRLLKNKRLRMVHCQWLDDCFEKDEKLQEEEYSLKPTGLSESISSDSEHVLEAETFSSLKNDDKAEKKKPVNLKTRGRKPTTRRKTVLNQPKRTKGRSGNKSVKINEYVSDEDNLSLNESHVTVDEEKPYEIQDVIVDDNEPLENHMNIYPDAQIRTEYGVERGDPNPVTTTDKLEVMVDPVQAMLLDMIPSLEPKRLEPKVIEKTSLDTSVPKRENVATDSNPGPSKKKKVSYKDLAMDLLRD